MCCVCVCVCARVRVCVCVSFTPQVSQQVHVTEAQESAAALRQLEVKV